MKKTMLSLMLGGLMVSGSVMAQDFKATGYIGAELGGDVLLDEQYNDAGSFEADNMVKMGAELTTEIYGVKTFVGSEVRFGMQGVDGDFHNGKYENGDTTEIHRFVVGVDTQAGRTEFGIQEGLADTYDEFADLSMEHGLNAEFEAAIDGDQTIQHVYSDNTFEAGASYDFETESYALGAKAKVYDGVEVGGAYVDDGEGRYAYTAGLVYSFSDYKLAGKYAGTDFGTDTGDAFSVSASYALNDKVAFAGSYNVEGEHYNGNAEETDYATLGASYQLNKNIEFVTDYKFASENDDRLFLRANINY